MTAVPAHATDDSDVDLAAIQAFTDEDGGPATLPEMGNVGEEGKFKVIMGLLKKCVSLGPIVRTHVADDLGWSA